MATLTDLFRDGHRRACRASWLPGNYLQLIPIPDGKGGEGMGPWADLYFPSAGMEEFACPYRTLTIGEERTDWEPYEGEPTPPRGGLNLAKARELVKGT